VERNETEKCCLEKMLAAESKLLALITRHDGLVDRCASGALTFSEFIELYDDFYWRCALDGHEGNDEEAALLVKHSGRVAIHRRIANEILANLASTDDSNMASFKDAGRHGPDEAVRRLRALLSARSQA
jgi:hypothetical protein